MSTIEFRRFSDLPETARAAAQALVGRLGQLLGEKQVIHLSVTGGTLGIATLAAVSELSETKELDWSRVHVWWGDERFVEPESPDRNFNQAVDALFQDLPAAVLHPMPSKSKGLQLDEATELFAVEVAKYYSSGKIPFDLTLLGMGPDGHVASLFPGIDYNTAGAAVIAEHNSPKPPSERISFTFDALNNSTEVWFLVAGGDKAPAAAQANSKLAGTLPAGRVKGLEKTVWFLDEAAASQLI